MKYKNFIYGICVAALASLCAACYRSEGPEAGGSADEGIRIRLGIDNGTRAVEAGVGNESKIDTVTFLFFDAAGNTTLKRTLTPDDLADTVAQPYWSESDILVFPKSDDALIAQATSLYVVVNHIPAATTKSDLQKEILTKETFPKDSTSLFVMEGHRENGVPFDVNNVPLTTIQLRRCALKLRLLLTLGEPGKGNLANVEKWGGVPRARRMNVTLESYITEAVNLETVHDFERSADRTLTRFYPDSYLPEEIAVNGGTLSKLEGYAYECDWSLYVRHELVIYMNLPYYDKTKPGGEVMHNYYKIHLNPQRLRRNTVYEVRATVNDLGSPTIDLPTNLKQRNINIYDWFGKPIDVTVTNDYLTLYSSRYSMYGETLDFKYKASSQPEGYLVTVTKNEAGENVFHPLPPTEASVDLSDYSVGSGQATVRRKMQPRFTLPTPHQFSCYLRVRTIVKPVVIDQYPSSYYGTLPEGGPDYFHIITPMDTEEFSIGYSLEKGVDGYYVTSNQEATNKKVSPDFIIFQKELTVDGRTFSVNDKVSLQLEAVNYCKDLQKATGLPWVLPTEREMQLIALACTTPKEDGSVSYQLPEGKYFVARASSDYYGNVVSIPDGVSEEVGYYTGSYYVRCVRNAAE